MSNRSRSTSRTSRDGPIIRSASSTDAELSALRAQQRADRDARSVGRRLQQHQIETSASLGAMQNQMEAMTQLQSQMAAMMTQMQSSINRFAPQEVPTWLNEVQESYAEDEHCIKLLQALTINASSHKDYTLQSGILSRAAVKRGRNERPPGCRTSTRVPNRAAQSSGPNNSAGGRKKTSGRKRKDKDEVPLDELVEKTPNFNIGTVQISGWRRLRDENPYRFKERTYTGEDKEFWTETRAAIWDEFYNYAALMKNGIIVMTKAINKEELTMFRTTKYRFVVDTLQKMDLLNLVCLKPTHFKSLGEYCPILVRQFHCTVFFHDDPTRTMTWMTRKEKYSCNYLDFCEAMGFGSGRARGVKIHIQEQFAHGNIALCYPPEPTHNPPLISGMYYSYQVLANIFRESLFSKSGDSSDCRSYHLNLMYCCHHENMKTIDGCDYLYNELKCYVRNRMTPNFAQYIQQLINTVVPSPYNKKDEVVKMDPFMIPQQGHKLDIPETMPSERRTKERHDPAASSSSSMRPKRGASRFLANMCQMCRNTNDVAHQSLALNQETRRRQNEFMAARNHVVPPPGPELEHVVAPTWEMPSIDDNMFQNFDLSLFARGGSSHGAPPPMTRSRADTASDAAGSSSNRTGDDE
ncbi:hypothetical protein QYE76_066807 [Lolium multiflorum]|uniref:Uncharacterized protein n=1 Tax=Lolium multiflorum TaxID=4521 RepID=A0AAD8SDG6_LOLMU|nr:hypothetical protein QYE76_066807 [Lolium multiflorum]